MARIRTVKPEFFTSEQIVECSTNARLLFVGQLCFSDDAGRHPASVKRLKMEVFPGDSFSCDQVGKWEDELINAGLVVEYESQGEKYWQVTGWEKHQKVDRPTVKFPGPFDEGSSITRRGLALESNGMESNGSKAATSAAHTNRFKKPTLEEVRDYCRERKNKVDPQRFVDFYESKGWMVGKTPMKDWKASVRTWEKNDESDASPPSQRTMPLGDPALYLPGKK